MKVASLFLNEMKEIIAIIRPERWKATKARLEELGFFGVTEHRVFGRGRQNGLRYLKPGTKEIAGISYIPKRLIQILVSDDAVPPIVSAIQEINKTPAMGDGKIFVCPVEEVYRVRTNEAGELALA